jgi:hypothetical protein
VAKARATAILQQHCPNCFVRARHRDQIVLTTYGRSSGFCIDPIEKKPLNHFLPGTPVLSFGTAGCNLTCKFCQNWDISKARDLDRIQDFASPQTIVEAAVRSGCRSVAFTYNDPVIFLEYAIDVAQTCRERGVDRLGADVPLHFTAFHPDWKMMDRPPTPPQTLRMARQIAKKAGLRYVYTGNVHDPAGQSTRCYGCDTVLIGRDWYDITTWNLSADGRCLACGTRCHGVFEAKAGGWGPRRQLVRLQPSPEPGQPSSKTARRGSAGPSRGPVSPKTADRVESEPSHSRQSI